MAFKFNITKFKDFLICELIGHNYPEYDQAKRNGCECTRCGDVPLTFVRTSQPEERKKATPQPAYRPRAQSFTQG